MLLGNSITIKGAREHNLKNINLTIPRDKFIVITGVSGSGKSSLAFDTIYAEGQRRYVESLSAYARQFLEQMKKPDVDLIDGLSPAISIDQQRPSANPRSTVGTVTEIYDYFRILYSKIGKSYCYKCSSEIKAQTPETMIKYLYSNNINSSLTILAPIVRGRKGHYKKELDDFRRKGFTRAQIDGVKYSLSEEISLDKNKQHNIDIEIDRLKIKASERPRVSDSLALALRHGNGMAKIIINEENPVLISEKSSCSNCGINYPEMEPRFFSFNSPYGACSQCNGMGENEKEEICTHCNGTRLRVEARHIRVSDHSLPDLCENTVSQLLKKIASWRFKKNEDQIANPLIKEITSRLLFLENVGLGYLALNRSSKTLSGGEGQRIRLAGQIGSSLTGVIYILDEPSIGLHQRDMSRLLQTLKQLRDQGNTVIVVEHEEETIREADFIVDIGPGAGTTGGKLLVTGSLLDIINNPNSITGAYISGKKSVSLPKKIKSTASGEIVLRGARVHNLKNIDIKFPLGLFTCVTGVSGSGKSSLVIDTLFPAIDSSINNKKIDSEFIKSMDGSDSIDKVIIIDHSPIGRTSRSNPATYSGLLGHIRDLFSKVPESKLRGYRSGRFSFNTTGGRCEACEGHGTIKIEMHFLPDVHVECQTCRGARYNRDTLDIFYRNKNIADVLNLTVIDAIEIFKNVPVIKEKLETLNDVGLGYIHLGQSATTLSGGEAQRLKLAKELSRRATGSTLYILDEPTTGLHFADIQMLLSILYRLRDAGNTIVVIEHNLDVIKSADYIIDLGPDGGENGGRIIAAGSPEEIIAVKESYTGQFLKTRTKKEYP